MVFIDSLNGQLIAGRFYLAALTGEVPHRKRACTPDRSGCSCDLPVKLIAGFNGIAAVVQAA